MYNNYNIGYFDDCYDDSFYNMNQDFPMRGYGSYKPLKATTRNVQECISEILGCYPQDLKFIKLDEIPIGKWMHSCYKSGVTKMRVNKFVFEDGSTVTYAVCPFFPQCNTVHYHVDREGVGF